VRIYRGLFPYYLVTQIKFRADWREHKAGKPTQGRVSSLADLGVRGNAKTPERLVR
jgi:hypothetical protein